MPNERTQQFNGTTGIIMVQGFRIGNPQFSIGAGDSIDGWEKAYATIQQVNYRSQSWLSVFKHR